MSDVARKIARRAPFAASPLEDTRNHSPGGYEHRATVVIVDRHRLYIKICPDHHFGVHGGAAGMCQFAGRSLRLKDQLWGKAS